MKLLRQHTLTQTEAAAMVGIHYQTLRNWTSARRYNFPRPRRLGGRIYYSSAEIEAWLASPDRVLPGLREGERHHNAYPKELVAQALRMHLNRGFSLDRVAEILGVSKPAVQKWVNGSRRASGK